MQLSCENDLATFGVILVKLGNFLISSSGHTLTLYEVLSHFYTPYLPTYLPAYLPTESKIQYPFGA